MGFPTISPTGSEDSSSAVSGSEGSEKDKKNGGITTKDAGVALNSLILALFMICSLF
ncbi:hypothetical protein EUTSA_v10002151mg [Eutrema salsugineum]|uniref:Uncharacterized protein n=2 Tax=Eutrema salsugineum TaxID=72664 RepID=V4M584_EUTSA|nr:hypothetical protein EUTSA_v10002151mg [Eutrema salsugineum]